MTKQDNILTAYFSWSGNTQTIANKIYELVGGSLFRIQELSEYPSKYNDVLEVAKKEIRQEEKPELKENISNTDGYDVVFLGFPNWWNTFPAPVRTFLSENKFIEKTIIPFCTHGGGGSGHSFSDIAKLCPKAEVIEALSINGNAVNNSNDTIRNWLENVLKSSIS